jgi:hypothetical protein
MSDLFNDGIHIVRRDELNNNFTVQWISLFIRCFGGTEEKAMLIFQKYILNDSMICCMFKSGVMIAAYCGIKLNSGDILAFLSTDTMSDGTKKGSSVILGKKLYDTLILEGVSVVFGYPNQNIRRIRERGLGWTLDGSLQLYFGIPFAWRFYRQTIKKDILWTVVRPVGGWFTREKPFLINLLGRNGLYSSDFGMVITLSSYRPGLFFMRVPSFIFAPRTFGYKFLIQDEENKNLLLNKIKILDIDTIDIP